MVIAVIQHARQVVYDRGMRGLVWIVALCACGKGGGVQISVQPDASTTVTSVRLFIGTGGPSPRTLTVGNKFSGMAWIRDSNIDDFAEPVTNGRADFFIEPGAASTTMPIVIAVGFDSSGAAVGGGELTNVQVPDSGYVTYAIPLVSSTEMQTWDVASATTLAANKCARFNTDLVVNANDEDCDGLIDGMTTECMPEVYKGTRNAAPDEFDCLPRAPDTSTGMCYAGGPQCMDGTGQLPENGACVASGYCVPPLACNALNCMGKLDCLHTIGNSPIPHVACVISTTKHNGNLPLCGMMVPLPASSAPGCTNVRMRDDQQNYTPTLEVGDSAGIDATNSACNISLTPHGTIAMPATGEPPSIGALMAVDTMGAAATRARTSAAARSRRPTRPACAGRARCRRIPKASRRSARSRRTG
jgi:hypothetical protein